MCYVSCEATVISTDFTEQIAIAVIKEEFDSVPYTCISKADMNTSVYVRPDPFCSGSSSMFIINPEYIKIERPQ